MDANTRKILVQLPLFAEERNLKFYSVVLGHIGEQFPNDKTNRELIKKVFQVFEKMRQSKNLYYLCNFLRERARIFSFYQNGVNGTIMIRKLK